MIVSLLLLFWPVNEIKVWTIQNHKLWQIFGILRSLCIHGVICLADLISRCVSITYTRVAQVPHEQYLSIHCDHIHVCYQWSSLILTLCVSLEVIGELLHLHEPIRSAKYFCFCSYLLPSCGVFTPGTSLRILVWTCYDGAHLYQIYNPN